MPYLLYYIRRTIMFTRQHHSQLHGKPTFLLVVALLASLVLLAHSLATTHQTTTHYARSLHPSIGYPQGASPHVAFPHNSTPQVAYPQGASLLDMTYTGQTRSHHSLFRLQPIYRLFWLQFIHRLSI
ncbi:hypothetical protein [Ktedonobacter robiniae]|uniref:hypothetical protein n=1 Tax=Ktedonobacter robiniae TaxID=2778365 RepID=UPI001915E0A4|nr:hypothetical protein [Ktedonobacter robiniae]